MLKRMEVFFIASMFIMITTIILVVYTMQREEEFKSHNTNTQSAVVHGAAYAINLQLQNKRRHVRLFLEEYASLFLHLEKNPLDENASDAITERLKQRFPDFFTFTITNPKGEPILFNIDSLVGEECQSDLNNYASRMKWNHVELNNEVTIHPQPLHYHYDIMSPLRVEGASSRIFFTSFYAKEIANILATHEIPGQQLFLTKQSEPTLIEISRLGARNKLNRDNTLSFEERSRIIAFENIPESDWRLVLLPDANIEEAYVQGLWEEVITILAIVALALYLLIFYMFKLTENKHN